MRRSRMALFQSFLALLLCFSMLVGTTFAWFTDGVSSGNNTIAAGSLDIEMEYRDAAGTWQKVTEITEVLDKNALWEPGHTEVAYLKITNAGSLALKYALGVQVNGERGSINAAGEAFKLSDFIQFGIVASDAEPQVYADRNLARNALTDAKLIREGYVGGNRLYPKNSGEGKTAETYVTMVVYMPEEVGNAANYATGQEAPQVQLGIQLVATQEVYESDSFGTDYDAKAEVPGFTFPEGTFGENASADVTAKDDNNQLTEGLTINGTNTNASIPAGVKLAEDTEKLTLAVSSLSNSEANISLGKNDELRALDVHVEGVSADNTVPMEIYLKEAAAKGLNAGNLKLYHVENDDTVKMTLVDTFSAHNQFKYDPATGDITLYMATFSEVALVADTENAWKGEFDYSWYKGRSSDYTLVNADQLAAFGAIVGGMNGQTQDSFAGKTVKLIADVNLGDKLFYPIGYYNNTDSYERTGGSVSSTVNSFKGTFDGAGHTIANFHQNTWEMFGDYNDGYPAGSNYYKDAMGLFGYVYGGTVKNLTIDNFKSEGEFAPTGCVAAYAANATFENIAITNSHPATYNTSVAAVVGRDGENGCSLNFKNITVDNTNEVEALWGSWDVGAAGILGYLGAESSVNFENCNVSARLNVYNDVCANYQYYWYRYCGMLIGTVARTDSTGAALDLSKVSATNCYVNFGTWNDYWYCELVHNSQASYTHDHQMSRLTAVNGEEEMNTTGTNHYLFNGECYHYINGVRHYHDIADSTNPEIYETVNEQQVLKEDKYLINIPFNQVFGGKGWGVKGTDIDALVVGITVNGKLLGVDRSEIEKSDEKFETKFTEDFLYRVGNQNSVSVGSLFAAMDGATINNSGVVVSVDKVDENSNVGGTFTANTTDWTKGTIQFSGTGKVKVTIQDYNFCTPTELTLEVVDAVNATGATSATSNNVVLLNDCGFGSLEVSGGYSLYGNGFTMTCGSDSAALDMGYSFVTLNNGTLDNVQIVCPKFDYAVLYKSNMTESGNRSETTDKTRYFNVKSGVMVSGNSQILNSRISGARAAVNVTGGNVIIDNSRIELGAVASVLVGAANKLTLRNVTLVQEPAASTYDSSKTLMGFSVLAICDANGNSAPITLEGKLVQNAWVNEDCSEYVPSAGKAIVETVMKQTDFLHDIGGKQSLNLGIAYMPESLTSAVNATTITDNRTNKDAVPYDYAEVNILNGKTYVYSYKNTNGTDGSTTNNGEYKPNAQSDIITVTYSDTADGLTTGKSYDTNGWVYELNVDLDKLPVYALDFSKLSMSVNGVPVTDFKVNNKAKPTSPVTVTAGGTTYTLTATVDGKEYTAFYKVTGTETSKDSPSKISGPTTAGFGVAKSYGSDWSGAADVLTGVKIKYWSVAENKYIEHDFSNFTVPGNAGKLNGTNNYWEYTHTNNDFTLKVTNTVAIHSGKSVYGMPIRGTDGKLYFTISSTNGYVGSGTTSRAITMQYEFTDNNGGEKLTFTHTFNISYSKDDQYSYSDLSGSGKLTPLKGSSGSGSSSCVTPDTLITLANGKQVRVDSLTGSEELLVWNLETGKYDTAPIVFVDSDEEMEYEVIHLYFSDGFDVKVISEHGFFDLDLGKYVYIDAKNYAEYVGHRFVTEGEIAANKWNIVTLDKVELETEVTTAWSPVTFEHLCYYTNGVLSMPGGIEGLFNIFEVNTDTMRYDAKQMQEDIETYGLFTLEDFGGMISEEAFQAFNGAYLKVAMGKGLLTWEDIAYMAERYIPLM